MLGPCGCGDVVTCRKPCDAKRQRVAHEQLAHPEAHRHLQTLPDRMSIFSAPMVSFLDGTGIQIAGLINVHAFLYLHVFERFTLSNRDYNRTVPASMSA